METFSMETFSMETFSMETSPMSGRYFAGMCVLVSSV